MTERLPKYGISTHTPLAGRDFLPRCSDFRVLISTHTPLAGRDCPKHAWCVRYQKFLLTRPSRGVTILQTPIFPLTLISTHTPLAGRDWIDQGSGYPIKISTHTPLAGRDEPDPSRSVFPHEISTHTPLAGRDLHGCLCQNRGEISTHTPLAGRDWHDAGNDPVVSDFYSHAPRGA